MSPRPLLTGLKFLSLCLALLGLAGCGGEPDNGNAGKMTLRLGFFPNVTHGAALVGTTNGAFAKALGPNVTLEEKVFNAGPAEIEALFGDQIDLGYIGPGPAVNGFLKSQGKALRIVSGAASGGAALVVREDSGITNIRGLAGKMVAVPQIAGTQDISLRHALQEVGLTSTDKGGNVSILPATSADTLTLFKKKSLDAAWVAEPWVARLVKEGHGKILIDERDLWPKREFASAVVIVRTKFLNENPELVEKFLRSHALTLEWMKKNPAETQKIIGQAIKKLTTKALPDDVLSAALSRTEFTFDPVRESVMTFAGRSRELGYLREDPKLLRDLFDLQIMNIVLRSKP